MMSPAQFSSKILKDLKEQRFFRKIWLTQGLRSASQFSSKMLKNLKEHGFCTKVSLAQTQLSEVFSCKDKLCSFCELPAWWKTSQTPLLTKIRDFESTETSKIWNLKSQILNTSFHKSEAFWTLCGFKNLKMQALLIFDKSKGLNNQEAEKIKLICSNHILEPILSNYVLQIDVDLIEKLIPCSWQWPLQSQACPSKFS